MAAELTVRVRPRPACAAPGTRPAPAGRRGRGRRLLTAALLALLTAVAGCASAPARPGPPAAPANDPATSPIDLLFLTMMAAHIDQTRQIVRLGLDRAMDPEIRTLIAAIDVTEADEQSTMRGWLRESGPSAAAVAAHHDHTGHSAAAAGLARLRAAPPGQVDTVLLDVLGTQQRQAADLARAQVRAGASARVRELAGRIERSRTAEVALMAKLRVAHRP